MTASPSTTDSLPARLPSLTGIRIVLFTLAFITHAFGAAQFFKSSSINALGSVLPSAISTLSLFFILSGFVLTWQRPWNSSFTRFARKRIAKIFPSHIVIWVLTMALLTIVGPIALIGKTAFGPAVANLFLVQTWIPDPSYVFSVYGINWSVSADIVFYISLPLLIRPIMRIPGNRLWMWLVGLMVVIGVLPAVIKAVTSGPVWPMWAPFSFPEAYYTFFFPISRLPEFLLGIILARMMQTGTFPRVRMWWVWLATAAMWGALFILPDIYQSSGVMAISVCFFIPVLACRDIEGRSKWLSRRSMVVLGDATYAAYLFQFPILGVVKQLLGPTVKFDAWPGFLIVLGIYVLNLTAGLILYRFVEQPVLRRFARSGRKRDVAPAPQPGAVA